MGPPTAMIIGFFALWRARWYNDFDLAGKPRDVEGQGQCLSRPRPAQSQQHRPLPGS